MKAMYPNQEPNISFKILTMTPKAGTLYSCDW